MIIRLERRASSSTSISYASLIVLLASSAMVAAPQPAQATPGGPARSATAQNGRWAYESGGNFLARRAGETLQNVMSPVTKNFGVAAKPTGVGPSPTERAKQQDEAARSARFSPGAVGNHMTRFM
jgi:hypothetical protein